MKNKYFLFRKNKQLNVYFTFSRVLKDKNSKMSEYKQLSFDPVERTVNQPVQHVIK